VGQVGIGFTALAEDDFNLKQNRRLGLDENFSMQQAGNL